MSVATQELQLATDAVRIESGADKTPSVSTMAYAGGLMSVPGLGRLVIDLSGIDAGLWSPGWPVVEPPWRATG